MKTKENPKENKIVLYKTIVYPLFHLNFSCYIGNIPGIIGSTRKLRNINPALKQKQV